MKAVQLIDIGSTYTKVTAVDLAEKRVIGTAKAFTTAESDVNNGLEAASRELEQQTGRIDYEWRLACSSAAGGLKMVAVGLVPELTVEAARMAALSAGAKVLKTYAYDLTEAEAGEIQQSKPDIILLAGGTDGGNKSVILHNAEKLAELDGNFPVIVAGNKSADEQACAILARGGKQATVCENVLRDLNTLNIEPARAAIRDIFLSRIVLANGLTRVRKLIQGILMPTPAAVLKAVTLLAHGDGRRPGLGDLLAVDVGGATTDVYSVAEGLPTKPGVVIRGLPEPLEKRTVEGDLGVRYSADSLADAVGIPDIAQHAGLQPPDVSECLDLIRRSPGVTSEKEPMVGRLDLGLAEEAVRLAVKRHVGRVEEHFSSIGAIAVQHGKDLSGVRKVIGTGGPVVHSVDPGSVLAQACFDQQEPDVLRPLHPEFLVDSKYIFAAMGLLSSAYPEMAFDILIKELV